MSPTKRIFINVVATYGRSMYALLLGLLSGRWVLMALGQSDYGIVGLIGGLVSFISVFNAILSTAVGRFYAVGIGFARRKDSAEEGLEECRRWFNIACMVHFVFPVLLVVIGAPIGLWAIDNILLISESRIQACHWIWFFTCASCFVAMATVPFKAMYIAKQEIAELTVYDVAVSTFNAVFLYYMVEHPGYWLVKYSAWASFINAVPLVVISIRALFCFQECRFNRKYMLDVTKLKELFRYSIARFWSDFSNMISTQGQAILINRHMGVNYNASMAVGASVAAHTMTLANSLSGAFWPAIANKCGEGEYDEVKRLHSMTCRIGAVLILLFALPFSLESEMVLKLWLVDPPYFSSVLAIFILLRMTFLRMTDGYWMAILGSGKGVMRYSWTVGWAEVGLVVVAAVGFVCGLKMWSIVLGYMFSAAGCVVTRLYYGRSILGFSIREWILHTMIPIVMVSIVCILVGILIKSLMQESFARVVVLTLACESVFVPSTWLFVMTANERIFIKDKVISLKSRIFR